MEIGLILPPWVSHFRAHLFRVTSERGADSVEVQDGNVGIDSRDAQLFKYSYWHGEHHTIARSQVNMVSAGVRLF